MADVSNPADSYIDAPESVDKHQIAEVLGVSSRRVEQRAKNENWTHSTTTSRGGPKRIFHVAGLPGDVKTALELWRARRLAQQIREGVAELNRSFDELLVLRKQLNRRLGRLFHG